MHTSDSNREKVGHPGTFCLLVYEYCEFGQLFCDTLCFAYYIVGKYAITDAAEILQEGGKLINYL